MAITNLPVCQKIRDFLILKNFAALRLCARKVFIVSGHGTGGVGIFGRGICQKCRGVKSDSRKAAKEEGEEF
jgi:hypothetical protein